MHSYMKEGEILTRQAWLVLLVALLGAIIMLWSPEVGYPWPGSLADWLAISSGFAFAMTNMFINMANRVSIQMKVSASWLGVIFLAGLALFIRSEDVGGTQLQVVFYAMLVGVIFMGVTTWAVVYGVTHMPVHRSAVILLFEVVASLVSTYLLIEERLSMLEWVGGISVIAAAYFAARLPHPKPIDMS